MTDGPLPLDPKPAQDNRDRNITRSDGKTFTVFKRHDGKWWGMSNGEIVFKGNIALTVVGQIRRQAIYHGLTIRVRRVDPLAETT